MSVNKRKPCSGSGTLPQSDKEAVAQSEVDAFMENCAKRWQTKEGTYQLKRRRLKPFFFSWMLHGSTKVVVRAVALLSANTRINRMKTEAAKL